MGEGRGKSPKECFEMADVRAEIDRIDRALVDLIAERFGYVDRAWQLKQDGPEGAVVPWRIQQVIDRVKVRADERGVSAALIEALWRQMIGWFIQYEEERLRKHFEHPNATSEGMGAHKNPDPGDGQS